MDTLYLTEECGIHLTECSCLHFHDPLIKYSADGVPGALLNARELEHLTLYFSINQL